MPKPNRQQTALLTAALISAVLKFVPGASLILLPLEYLNTHLHELMHALGALATGGSVGQIKVFANAEGSTTSAGGVLLVIASAGYVGSAIAGGMIIALCRDGKSAQIIARVLAVLLAVAMLLWVRGDLVGIISGALWIFLLWVLQTIKDVEWRMLAVQFVGVQQCLNALDSLRDLLILSKHTNTTTDAMIMQEGTGISAMVWAIGWGILSVAALVMAGSAVFRRSPLPR